MFVTTAGFTSAARDYVARSPKRIVLIDGEELARLMARTISACAPGLVTRSSGSTRTISIRKSCRPCTCHGTRFTPAPSGPSGRCALISRSLRARWKSRASMAAEVSLPVGAVCDPLPVGG